MDNTFEKAYTPKEVNITLGISDSALRKWCLALKKNGYKFIRNDHKQRVFVENDLVVLRHFQNLVKHHNMQLENAAALVVDRFGKEAFEVGTGVVPVKKEEKQSELQSDFIRSFDDKLNELLERMETQEEINNELLNRLGQQENFNKELVQRLEQQQKYIEEHLEQRDRRLMESLRESQEVKQQLLQIATAQEEEKKKGFFARLFGK